MMLKMVVMMVGMMVIISDDDYDENDDKEAMTSSTLRAFIITTVEIVCSLYILDDHRGKDDDSDGSEHKNYGSEPEHNIMLDILVKPWLTVVRLRLRRISQHSESDCYFLRFNAHVGYTINMMEVSVLVWALGT